MSPDTASSPEALFADRLRARPADPIVTFYDVATDERMELSASSLGNWIAKTYWLLSDEYGPGNQLFLDVPLHWTWYVAALGAWSAGLSLSSAAGTAQVAVLGGRSLDDPPIEVDVYALSLLSWGRPFDGNPPAGTEDFVLAVRPQADDWNSVRFAAGPDDPALDELPRADLARLATARASDLGLAAGGRLLVSDIGRGPSTDTDTVVTLLAPLAVGGSVVLVRNAEHDPAALDRIGENESVTARA